MIYILITVTWVYAGSHIVHQEFNSLETCLAAKASLVARVEKKFSYIECHKK